MDDRTQALHQVAKLYQQSGYVRGPIPERLLQDGWRVYKKSWELRISLPDEEALVPLRRAIDRAGLRLARFHWKRSRIIQPIYGREQVLRVLRAAGVDTTEL